MKKRTLFTFNVDNIIDLITNSSSELFVLDGQTKETVEEMIKSVYPEYLNEYEGIKSFDELDNYDLDTYLSYRYSYSKQIIPGFTPDEMYEDYDSSGWYNTLKDNFVQDNRDKIKEMIDPADSLWFLYSKDDNPNWDMQEELSGIGYRIHMG